MLLTEYFWSSFEETAILEWEPNHRTEATPTVTLNSSETVELVAVKTKTMLTEAREEADQDPHSNNSHTLPKANWNVRTLLTKAREEPDQDPNHSGLNSIPHHFLDNRTR